MNMRTQARLRKWARKPCPWRLALRRMVVGMEPYPNDWFQPAQQNMFFKPQWLGRVLRNPTAVVIGADIAC
jgi:hypothetical protein